MERKNRLGDEDHRLEDYSIFLILSRTPSLLQFFADILRIIIYEVYTVTKIQVFVSSVICTLLEDYKGSGSEGS